jgi:hypothetical protein
MPSLGFVFESMYDEPGMSFVITPFGSSCKTVSINNKKLNGAWVLDDCVRCNKGQVGY